MWKCQYFITIAAKSIMDFIVDRIETYGHVTEVELTQEIKEFIPGNLSIFNRNDYGWDSIDSFSFEDNIFKICKPSKHIQKEIDNFDLDNMITHPAHYSEGRKYEPIKIIEDYNLSFNLGNALKYIARAGRKGSLIEDLEKALYYIEEELSVLKERLKRLNHKNATYKNIYNDWEDVIWITEVDLQALLSCGENVQQKMLYLQTVKGTLESMIKIAKRNSR